MERTEGLFSIMREVFPHRAGEGSEACLRKIVEGKTGTSFSFETGDERITDHLEHPERTEYVRVSIPGER